MKKDNLSISRKKIEDFCKNNHIKRFSFFGSVLRPNFNRKSDIDVLVEFDKNYIPGLNFFGMETELSKILKRKVDLNTPDFISPYFRKRVLSEAKVQYVRA